MFKIIKTHTTEDGIDVEVECIDKSSEQISQHKCYTVHLDDPTIKNPHNEYELIKEILINNNIIEDNK